jgi:cysteine synthase A
MLEIPDDASIGCGLWLRNICQLDYGPSTGCNLAGALILADELERQGKSGTIVTLGCDPGWRYDTTVYDASWLIEREIDPNPWVSRCQRYCDGAGFDATGILEVDGFKHEPRPAS